MARSIHTTRRQLEELRRARYADREKKREELKRLREELWKKQRIKAQVIEERQSHDIVRPSLIDPAQIPIVIIEQDERLHYPASPDDLVAVMRRLPPGVTDGIDRIELRLGDEFQSLADEDGEGDEPDPFFGRKGLTILPGVYSGRILGFNRSSEAVIRIFGYVYESSLKNREIKEFYLKLRQLSTLVHEIAHHHDHTARVARGRWLADGSEKLEIYAERMEYEWVRSAVIPYLEEVYPDEVRYFHDWILRHGGARVLLSLLSGDPQVTAKGGLVKLAFTLQGALETLLEDVEKGLDPLETRLEFARQIHYTDHYAVPREIIAGVLAEHPGHIEALTLEADIDVHEGNNAHAEALCREVLARDETYLDDWETLTDALLGMRRWPDLVEAATRALSHAEPGQYRYPFWKILGARALARLELGDYAALEEDLETLAKENRSAKAKAASLRAMMLLRQGRLEEALSSASASIAEKLPVAPELDAVRFEAAHRLGRPEEAGTLTRSRVDWIRDRGHGPWMDRLVEALGDKLSSGARQ